MHAPPGGRHRTTTTPPEPPTPRLPDEHRPSRRRLRRPLAAAAALDPTRLAAPQRDEAERVIAHLILSDPILIAAADRLLAGADTVTVDNRHAMDDDAIATLLASFSHPERIHALNHNASELIDPAPPDPRHRRHHDRAPPLHDRHGQLTHQSTTTWIGLLTARADQHLAAHARTLRRIADP